jgi:hypothetical protein
VTPWQPQVHSARGRAGSQSRNDPADTNNWGEVESTIVLGREFDESVFTPSIPGHSNAPEDTAISVSSGAFRCPGPPTRRPARLVKVGRGRGGAPSLERMVGALKQPDDGDCIVSDDDKAEARRT